MMINQFLYFRPVWYLHTLTSCAFPSQPVARTNTNTPLPLYTTSSSSSISSISGGGSGGGLLPLRVWPHEVLVVRLSLPTGGVHPHRVVRLVVIGVDLPWWSRPKKRGRKHHENAFSNPLYYCCTAVEPVKRDSDWGTYVP